jgi:Rod binding domain-containing protein
MENLPIHPKTEGPQRFPLDTQGGKKKLDRDKLKKSCADFEALFTQQLLKSMRQTTLRSDVMGKGAGKDMYESLFDQELSKSLAKRGGLGLGMMMYNRMVRQEEKQGMTPAEQDKIRTDPPALRIRSARERGNLNGTLGR